MDLINETIMNLREIASNLERYYYAEKNSSTDDGNYPAENLILMEDADGFYLAKHSTFTLSGEEQIVHEISISIEMGAVKIQRNHTITVDNNLFFTENDLDSHIDKLEELENMVVELYSQVIKQPFESNITRIRTTW